MAPELDGSHIGGGGVRLAMLELLRNYSFQMMNLQDYLQGIFALPCSPTSAAPLPFLDTYRTMCIAPDAGFQRILEKIGRMQLAA
jgi:hypothetical protein